MKNALTAICIGLVMMMTACGTQPLEENIPAVQDGRQGEYRQNFDVGDAIGKVVSIDDDKLIVDLAEIPQRQQMRGEGEQPPRRRPGENGQQPRQQPGENQQGQDGQRMQRQVPEMKMTGERGEYLITPQTSIETIGGPNEQQQQLSMEDLKEGTNVSIRLGDDKKTIVSIRVMRGYN